MTCSSGSHPETISKSKSRTILQYFTVIQSLIAWQVIDHYSWEKAVFLRRQSIMSKRQRACLHGQINEVVFIDGYIWWVNSSEIFLAWLQSTRKAQKGLFIIRKCICLLSLQTWHINININININSPKHKLLALTVEVRERPRASWKYNIY